MLSCAIHGGSRCAKNISESLPPPPTPTPVDPLTPKAQPTSLHGSRWASWCFAPNQRLLARSRSLPGRQEESFHARINLKSYYMYSSERFLHGKHLPILLVPKCCMCFTSHLGCLKPVLPTPAFDGHVKTGTATADPFVGWRSAVQSQCSGLDTEDRDDLESSFLLLLRMLRS